MAGAKQGHPVAGMQIQLHAAVNEQQHQLTAISPPPLASQQSAGAASTGACAAFTAAAGGVGRQTSAPLVPTAAANFGCRESQKQRGPRPPAGCDHSAHPQNGYWSGSAPRIVHFAAAAQPVAASKQAAHSSRIFRAASSGHGLTVSWSLLKIEEISGGPGARHRADPAGRSPGCCSAPPPRCATACCGPKGNPDGAY